MPIVECQSVGGVWRFAGEPAEQRERAPELVHVVRVPDASNFCDVAGRRVLELPWSCGFRRVDATELVDLAKRRLCGTRVVLSRI